MIAALLAAPIRAWRPPAFGLLLGATGVALSLTSLPLRVAAPDTSSTTSSTVWGPDSLNQGSLAGESRALADLGLESVQAWRSAGLIHVAYENRRFRHPATALGHVARLAGGAADSATLWAIERRWGLASSAVPVPTAGFPTRIIYPGEPIFPLQERVAPLAPTERSLDLLLRPLITYEVGRIYDPVLLRFEIAPELRVNPWPGARARASLIIPLRNDFSTETAHPDINRVRPGATTLEQFVWAPGILLISGTGGLFADNRYGCSAGLARPCLGGRVLLDAQLDVTGFIAFTDSGTVYSTPSRWTGFGGITWRPGSLDLAIRARAARFLYDDQGVELQVARSMGDLDIAFFAQRTGGFDVTGVRVVVPIPPMDRSVGRPVRIQLAPRFPLEYRDEAAPVGSSVREVASREEFLRQLNPSSLAANLDRYRRARGDPLEARNTSPPQWVSLTGMTGFVNTPWCGVIRDREFELGYNLIPKEAAYDHRDQHRNDVYYAALGFLPHLEAGLRWTVIPGLKSFSDLVPDSRLTDSDRMFSARVEILSPRPRRPGLALGIEDAVGTKRFHSTYAVAGMPFSFRQLRGRWTLGYAPPAFTASHHTLDGAFGAVEVCPWRAVALAFEHDSEKLNTSLGLDLGFGFRARAALLDLHHVSAGVGWYCPL